MPQIRGKDTVNKKPIDLLIDPSGILPVSLGSVLGKTRILIIGRKVTTAITLNQVILTYTVSDKKIFYLNYLLVMCRLTTFATTATLFGVVYLQSPDLSVLVMADLAGPGITAPPIIIPFSEPIPITMNTVVEVTCTPSASTSFTWVAGFGGYEK